MKHVRFRNNGIDMAGHVYFPANFQPARKYPAVVVVHPGGVKEQAAGLFARMLA